MLYLSSLTPRLTVILCSVLVNYVSGVTVREMFPFGPEAGDIELLWGDYAWRWISLRTPVTTFGTLTTHVQIHNNGWVELVQKNGSLSTAGVLVFPPEMTTDTIGHVFYRETTDPDLLSSTGKTLGQLFPGLGIPTSVVVITYGSYSETYGANKQPLIQLVLGTDGANSFAILLYAEELKLWIPSDQDRNGSLPAPIGFLTATGFWSIFIPWPGYPYGDVMNTITTCNTGVSGFWAFQINEESVRFPLTDECELGIDTCDPNAECIDLSKGFDCACNYGFTGDGVSCSESVDDRRSVGGRSGNGSTVPAGLTVGFALAGLSVREDDGTVWVCVEIKDGDSVNLEQSIEVTMSSFSCGLALEGSDYVPSSISPHFNMSNQGQQLCLSVAIIDDNTPEDNETFCVRLTARNPAVILDPANATVTIYDDDSKGTSLFQSASLPSQTSVDMEETSTLMHSSLIRQITSTISLESTIPPDTILLSTQVGLFSSLTSPKATTAERTTLPVTSSVFPEPTPTEPTLLSPTTMQSGSLSSLTSLTTATSARTSLLTHSSVFPEISSSASLEPTVSPPSITPTHIGLMSSLTSTNNATTTLLVHSSAILELTPTIALESTMLFSTISPTQFQTLSSLALPKTTMAEITSILLHSSVTPELTSTVSLESTILYSSISTEISSSLTSPTATIAERTSFLVHSSVFSMPTDTVESTISPPGISQFTILPTLISSKVTMASRTSLLLQSSVLPDITTAISLEPTVLSLSEVTSTVSSEPTMHFSSMSPTQTVIFSVLSSPMATTTASTSLLLHSSAPPEPTSTQPIVLSLTEVTPTLSIEPIMSFPSLLPSQTILTSMFSSPMATAATTSSLLLPSSVLSEPTSTVSSKPTVQSLTEVTSVVSSILSPSISPSQTRLMSTFISPMVTVATTSSLLLPSSVLSEPTSTVSSKPTVQSLTEVTSASSSSLMHSSLLSEPTSTLFSESTVLSFTEITSIVSSMLSHSVSPSQTALTSALTTPMATGATSSSLLLPSSEFPELASTLSSLTVPSVSESTSTVSTLPSSSISPSQTGLISSLTSLITTTTASTSLLVHSSVFPELTSTFSLEPTIPSSSISPLQTGLMSSLTSPITTAAASASSLVHSSVVPELTTTFESTVLSPIISPTQTALRSSLSSPMTTIVESSSLSSPIPVTSSTRMVSGSSTRITSFSSEASSILDSFMETSSLVRTSTAAFTSTTSFELFPSPSAQTQTTIMSVVTTTTVVLLPPDSESKSSNSQAVIGAVVGVTLFSVAVVVIVAIVVAVFVVKRRRKRSPVLHWIDPANEPAVYTVPSHTDFPMDIMIQTQETHANPMALVHLRESKASGIDTASSNAGDDTDDPDKDYYEPATDMESIDNLETNIDMHLSPTDTALTTSSTHSYDATLHSSGTVLVESLPSAESNVAVSST